MVRRVARLDCKNGKNNRMMESEQKYDSKHIVPCYRLDFSTFVGYIIKIVLGTTLLS